jgi:tetrahydromethanopterin S-methyltransferase subunit C
MLGNVYFGPILGVILSAILGGVIAIVGKKVIGMKIPVLVTGTMELTAAAAISVLGFSAAIAGGIGMAAIVTSVVATGFIGLLFIMNTMAIQHPFNACLGPQENRVRTLKLAASTGFISMAVVGILGGLLTLKGATIVIIGAIAWFMTMRMFLEASKEEAASVAWSGMWPKEEEL